MTCRLVLWASGECASGILSEAYRVLKNDGIIYVFEPDDHLLLFLPPKPFIARLIELWDRQMLSNGLDPFIGRSDLNASKRWFQSVGRQSLFECGSWIR